MGFFSFLFASLFVFLILEGFWGYWSIAFFQQVASLGNNIAIQIAAGSSLKVGQYIIPSDLYCASFPLIFFSIRLVLLWDGEMLDSFSRQAVYKHYHKEGTLTLQHFIIFFGAFELFLSQLPDIHSLRWVNALCTFSTIGFAGTTIGVTLYNGRLGKFACSSFCIWFVFISLVKMVLLVTRAVSCFLHHFR